MVIILAAIFASFAMDYINGGNSSFSTFKSNFDSAKRVDITVTAYNGTVLSSTIGCATQLIEQMVASKSNHRNSTTIDLSIINQTSCIKKQGLGMNTSNYTITSLQNCLNITSTEPTIYINYSSTNVTRIKSNELYIIAFVKTAKAISAQSLHDAYVNVGVVILHEYSAIEI